MCGGAVAPLKAVQVVDPYWGHVIEEPLGIPDFHMWSFIHNSNPFSTQDFNDFTLRMRVKLVKVGAQWWCCYEHQLTTASRH